MKKSIFFLLLLLSDISYAQTGLTSYTLPSGINFSSAWQKGYVHDCDPMGNLWIGTFSNGLVKFDGSNWTFYNTTNSPLPTNRINALCHDHQNALWLATDFGLGRFDGTTWLWYDSTNTNLGTRNIVNVYASGNKVLLLTRTATGTYKFFSNSPFPGVYLNIDVTPTIGTTSPLQYVSLCISPQGNFYMGSSANDKIIKIDGSGNQSLIDLTSLSLNFPNNNFYDVDNSENIWLTDKIYLDASLTPQTLQGCPSKPEAMFLFANPGTVGDYVRRNYQNEVCLLKNNVLAFTNIPPHQYFIFPNDTIPLFNSSPNRFAFTPSGECWIFCGLGPTVRWGPTILYKFNPSAYSYSVISNYRPSSFLDINEVETIITPLCDMHWDPEAQKGPQYMVPKCSGKNSVFSSATWFGGLDANDTLHLAAQTYRQDGLDFWPGPLDTLSASIDSATSASYNHVWKLSRGDVANFIYEFNLGNVTSGLYPVPYDILTWPAQGQGNYTRDLAPFFDNNSDGFYNPYDGDYPIIKGDQMCYNIFNDAIYPHTETGGKPLGIEVHKSSYAFTCPGITDSLKAINYTTFYDYEIFNRSDTAYHDMYMGLYADMDLGNWQDDYVGCDTLLNSGFVYNGDNDDEGYAGYGLNPPMQNVTILDGPLANPGDGVDNNNNGVIDEAGEKCLMTSFMYYNNDFTFWGNPSIDKHYYLYMQERWKDTSQVLGCDGLPTHYFFPGTPFDTTQCTEYLAGNASGDRRFLMGCGPFTLPAHDKTKISFAYVFTRDSLNPNGITTSVARNRSDVMKVRQWFAANNFPSCMQINPGIIENENLKPLFNLYPNPAGDNLQIQYSAQGVRPLYKVYDSIGRLVLSGKLKQNNSAIIISSLAAGKYLFEIVDGQIRSSLGFVKE